MHGWTTKQRVVENFRILLSSSYSSWKKKVPMISASIQIYRYIKNIGEDEMSFATAKQSAKR